ncbi:MAG: histidine kinase N-terminal 7TM domain-containing protein [Candidatus Promineifilaceae bacterium]
MSEQNVIYTILLTVSAIINVFVAAFAWRRREVPATKYLFFAMIGLVWWAGTYAIFWTDFWSPFPFFWLDMTYLGVSVAITFFFLFALAYTNNIRRLTRPLKILLIAQPVVNLSLLWTDSWHNLYFAGKRMVGSTAILDGGLPFWLNIAYLWGLLAVSLLLLWQMRQQIPALFRNQIHYILIGSLVPWLGTLVGILGLSPWPGLDLTPVAFTISGIMYVNTFYRYDFLSIMPIARDRLIDMMPEGVVVLDEKDKVIDLNPSAEMLLVEGGERIEMLVGRQPKGPLWLKVSKMGLDGKAAQQEMVVGEGEMVRYLDIHVSPLHADNGRFSGRLFMIRDITHTKQLEAALKRKNKELEAFTRIVAHDLKSPLGIILGYSEMLQSDKALSKNPAHFEMLHKIETTSQKMAEIIDNLLMLAYVEQQEVKVVPLSMGEIVEQALLRNSQLIETKMAEIVLPEKWPEAIGQAVWVEEVWANYISNGLKYGGKRPLLVLGADVQSNGMVRFWVKDNGPGIPQSEQHRLFKEFSRLGDGRIAGHGLGLSIVKQIVTRLNGEVGAESQVGQGTLFYFTLPLASQEQDDKVAI